MSLCVWIRDPCDSFNLKTEKLFVSYLWMTWIMISRILGNSKIGSITWITQIIFFHLLCLRSVLAILPDTCCQLTRITSQARQISKLQLYTNNLVAACVNGYWKIKEHELAWSLHSICLGMDFSDHLDQEISDMLFNTKAKKFSI